jgi:hypothetical protein
MLKIVAIVIVIAIAAVLLFAATRPDTFQVQRTATIQAPPEKIFPLINDFNRWNAWSPWEKKDPGMKRTFGTITAGKGAMYAWDGNKDVGQGSMEITESVAPSRLMIRLSFVRPFEAHNNVEFSLEPKGAVTQVTWTMNGPVPYISKIIHMFINIDRMVGGDFETGLASLKAIAEK